jgi:hypothetical protein
MAHCLAWQWFACDSQLSSPYALFWCKPLSLSNLQSLPVLCVCGSCVVGAYLLQSRCAVPSAAG